MKENRRIIWIGVVTVVTLGALTLFAAWHLSPDATRHNTAPVRLGETEGKGAPFRCFFNPSQKLAFNLRVMSRFQVNPTALLPGDQIVSPSPESDKKLTDATMLWHVISKSPDLERWTIAAILKDVSIRSGDSPISMGVVAELENTPVLFQIDDRCRMGDIGFTEHHSVAVVREWQMMLSLLEMVMPQGSTTVWQAVQSDSTGTFDVMYQATMHKNGVEIQRHRLNYTSVNTHSSDVTLRASILNSAATGTFDTGGSWFQQIKGHEHVALNTLEGRSFANVDSRITLKAKGIIPDDPLWRMTPQFKDYAFVKVSELLQTDDGTAQVLTEIPGINTLHIDEVLARVFEMRQVSPGQLDAPLDMLVQYLRADAAHVAALMAALKTNDIRETLRPLLFLALEKTGTRDAQLALLEASGDMALSTEDHLRAIAAMQDLPRPQPEVLAGIEEIWRQGHNDATDTSRSALLAMGTLAGNKMVPGEKREEFISAMRTSLSGASDSSARVNALGAMGNSRLPVFENDARAYLHSEIGSERTVAVETLERIGAPISVDEALSSLAIEESRQAQHVLGEAMVKRARMATATEIEKVISQLRISTTEASVRKYLIRFLGEQTAHSPAAKQALVDHFQVETSKSLLILIGRFVNAQDL